MSSTTQASTPEVEDILEEEPDSVAALLKRAWTEYQRLLVVHPLTTKAVSAGLISGCGEVLGSSLRPRAANQPTRVRSVGAFFLFGLVVNGPFFHWWYGTLEKLCRDRPSQTAPGLAMRLALDRLVVTPPFLVFTLSGLHFLLFQREILPRQN